MQDKEIEKKYGFLTTTGDTKVEKSHLFVECSCVCGDILYKRFDGLKNGLVKSCGKRDCRALSSMKEPIRDVYNFLTLTGNYEIRGENKIRFVEAVCVCGTVKFYCISKLKSEDTKSCGCKRPSLCIKNNTTHGCSSTKDKKRHPIYSSYISMKTRCYKESDPAYPNYGGRGVTVCDEWFNNFQSFFDWSLLNGWAEGLQIDKDIKGDGLVYSPENCIWTTSLEQNRNRRNNYMITAFGETKCLSAWLSDIRCNIGVKGLKQRILRGWSSELAITTKNVILYGNIS